MITQFNLYFVQRFPFYIKVNSRSLSVRCVCVLYVWSEQNVKYCMCMWTNKHGGIVRVYRAVVISYSKRIMYVYEYLLVFNWW